MNNMKTALAIITAPMLLAFLAGFFGLYMDDGVYTLIGVTMIVGIIWAWIIEMKRD